MNAPVNPKELELQTVEFKLDGQTIVSYEGETILKAAKRHGIDIPHLCFKDGYRPDGNCRACVVEINGERTLAPSCCRSATPGMEVKANSERALKSQKLVPVAKLRPRRRRRKSAWMPKRPRFARQRSPRSRASRAT